MMQTRVFTNREYTGPYSMSYNRPCPVRLPLISVALQSNKNKISSGLFVGPLRRRHNQICALKSPAEAGEIKLEGDGSSVATWRAFWSVVSASTWLGTFGAAAAFVLTQEALLIGFPVTLPLIALFASRQVERIDVKVSTRTLEERLSLVVENMGALVESQRAEIRMLLNEQNASISQQLESLAAYPEESLSILDAKLAALEGSVLSASRATQKATKDNALHNQELIAKLALQNGSLKDDIYRQITDSTKQEIQVLLNIESRIEAIEGALRNIQSKQSTQTQQISAQLAELIENAEGTVAALIKAESRSSQEVLQQLAAMISQYQSLGGSDVDTAAMLQTLKSYIGEELGIAVSDLLAQQRIALEELSKAPRPVDLTQWNQLGRKLLALEQSIGSMAEPTVIVEADQPELRSMLLDLRQSVSEISQTLGRNNTSLDSAAVAPLDTDSQRALNENIDSLSRAVDALNGRLGAIVEDRKLLPTDSSALAKELAEDKVTINTWLGADEEKAEADLEDNQASNELPLGQMLQPQTVKAVEIETTTATSSETTVQNSASGGLKNLQTAELSQPAQDTITNSNGSRAGNFEQTMADGREAYDSQTSSTLNTQGMQALQRAREMIVDADDADLGAADAQCWQAQQCFQKLLAKDPDNIKYLGNCGNAYLARGQVRKQMFEIAAADLRNDGDEYSKTMMAAADQLKAESEELLVLAGRQYRRILELDPEQARAFVNWGRAICVRAELARAAGDQQGADMLFENALEKFYAALELDPNNVDAMRCIEALP